MLHDWICSLTAASAAAAAAKLLSPEGGVKKVTEVMCGIMLAAVLASPFLRADLPAIALSMAEYRHTAAVLTEGAEEAEKQLLREHIEDQCAAYILREAHTLGAEGLHVTVKTKWRDENWVPYEARIEGTMSAGSRNALSAYMEAELGIPRERQSWDE